MTLSGGSACRPLLELARHPILTARCVVITGCYWLGLDGLGARLERWYLRGESVMGRGVYPSEFTIRLTRNDDGWWTSQVVERPAAISQGTDAAAAALSVLDALFEVVADERIA